MVRNRAHIVRKSDLIIFKKEAIVMINCMVESKFRRDSIVQYIVTRMEVKNRNFINDSDSHQYLQNYI
jgi:hypothetical protein